MGKFKIRYFKEGEGSTEKWGIFKKKLFSYSRYNDMEYNTFDEAMVDWLKYEKDNSLSIDIEG